MQFKQISAIRVGNAYDVLLYALSEEGDIYVCHTHPSEKGKGVWHKVEFKEPQA